MNSLDFGIFSLQINEESNRESVFTCKIRVELLLKVVTCEFIYLLLKGDHLLKFKFQWVHKILD